jgi:beta-glucanase (GH16 family)
VGQSGYTEIDMTECFNTSSPWCQFHVANPSFGIGRGCDAVYPIADNNWHVYDTVWTATSIMQYMDGVLLSTCNQRLSNPMFLIIQTQTGGMSGTPNNAYLPATLLIDYVKVTQP